MYFPVALVFLALPFLTQAHPSEATVKTGLSIPISKRSNLRNADGVIDITMLEAYHHHTIEKIKRGLDAFERNTGRAHPHTLEIRHSDSERRGTPGCTGSVPLTRGTDPSGYSYWSGPITVGSPPGSTFNVVFDTGSADLILFDKSCTSCTGHALYDSSKSTTAQFIGNPVTLKYGDSKGTLSISVAQYKDTVNLGGYTATGQVLGSAGQITNFQLPADGILGMAYQSASYFHSSPVFQTLYAEGRVPEPVFSFYVAKSNSEVCIGGVNNAHYTGSFSYVPVERQAYWQVSFDSINVNGQNLVGKASAIIDTGAPQLIGPVQTVQTIYNNIPGSVLQNGIWTFPCNTNVAMSITFGNTEFTISSATFNLGPIAGVSNNMCVGALNGADVAGGLWLIGEPFLQNVYTVFDFGNNQVGFAHLA